MDGIPRDARIACEGLVMCPLARSDRDVETCLRCPWLERFAEVGATRFVRCAPPFRSLPLSDPATSPA